MYATTTPTSKGASIKDMVVEEKTLGILKSMAYIDNPESNPPKTKEICN